MPKQTTSKKNSVLNGDSTKKASTKKVAKKHKDPNAPKRPATAFILYSNDHRNEVKAEIGTNKVTEVAKELGARWKALSQTLKATYVAKAAADKQRYEEEKAEYEANGGANGNNNGYNHGSSSE